MANGVGTPNKTQSLFVGSTPPSEESEKKKFSLTIGKRQIVDAITVVLGVIVAGLFSYISPNWISRIVVIGVVLFSIWIVFLVIGRIFYELDRSVDKITNVRKTCQACELQCSDSAKIMKDFNDTERHNDTQILRYENILTILRESTGKQDEFCKNEIKYHIQNKSTGILEKFKYESLSDAEFSKDFKPKIQIERPNGTVTEPECAVKPAVISGEETEFRYTMDMPLDIQIEDYAKLSIEYTSPAFSRLFIDPHYEFIGITIRYKTHACLVKVKLSLDMAQKYRLSQKAGNRATPWEVIDFSTNRMYVYEKYLSQTGQIPKYDDDEITWEVLNPKIGYKFKLFFSLEKK